MARILFDTGVFSVLNVSSAIGVGWQLSFYTADTTNEITTYNAPSGGSANTNPVLSDAEGRFPQIWIEDGQTIKWTLATDLGVIKVTVDDFAIVSQPPSFSPLLNDFLADPTADPLPIDYGGTGQTSAANALGALGGLPLAGGTVTGNIIRSTKGVHHFWDTAAMNNGNWFLTADSDPDPRTAPFPGKVWAKYS